MILLYLFPLFILSTGVITAITEKEYNTMRHKDARAQIELEQMANDYHRKGYYSVEKWLKDTQILDGPEFEQFLENTRWNVNTYHKCEFIYVMAYNSFKQINYVFESIRTPSKMSHHLKGSLLLTIGARLAVNDRGSPTAEEMIDLAEDIVDREAIVGSSFEKADEELNTLYKQLIKAVTFKNDGETDQIGFVQIELGEQRYRKFIEQNPGLELTKEVEEIFRKAEKIGKQIMQIEPINSSAVVNKFVRLAEKYFLLMNEVHRNFVANEYKCSEWECRSKAELLIVEQNIKNCII